MISLSLSLSLSLWFGPGFSSRRDEQLGKELGSRWRQLSEEEKEVFKAQAREENERRAKEKAEAGAKADAPDATTSVAPTKPPGLPTAVVKRLVLSDPDLKRISAPALNMVIATAEHFIRLMTERSRDVAVTSGKKTIKLQDVLAVAREGGWRMEAILGETPRATRRTRMDPGD